MILDRKISKDKIMLKRRGKVKLLAKGILKIVLQERSDEIQEKEFSNHRIKKKRKKEICVVNWHYRE